MKGAGNPRDGLASHALQRPPRQALHVPLLGRCWQMSIPGKQMCVEPPWPTPKELQESERKHP